MRHESKSEAESTATTHPAACAAADSNRKSGIRIGISIGLRRPYMQIFHDHHRVPILDIVEMLDLCLRQFSNNRHLCSFGDGRGVEKLLLDREESTLRLLTIGNRLLSLIERQLQELDLCSILQSFGLQHLAAQYHDLAPV